MCAILMMKVISLQNSHSFDILIEQCHYIIALLIFFFGRVTINEFLISIV